MASPRVCVGIVGAPHGVRGEVRVKPFTAEPEALAAYGPLETKDGSRSLKVLRLRLQKDMLVVAFEGVNDRDAAAALTRTELYVPRDRLPEPDDADEFYLADLIGLAAHGPDGAPLGRIVAVPNFGSDDLLEIAPGAGGATVYVPFRKSFVPEVDLAAGRVGLSDDALPLFAPGDTLDGGPEHGTAS